MGQYWLLGNLDRFEVALISGSNSENSSHSTILLSACYVVMGPIHGATVTLFSWSPIVISRHELERTTRCRYKIKNARMGNANVELEGDNLLRCMRRMKATAFLDFSNQIPWSKPERYRPGITPESPETCLVNFSNREYIRDDLFNDCGLSVL